MRLIEIKVGLTVSMHPKKACMISGFYKKQQREYAIVEKKTILPTASIDPGCAKVFNDASSKIGNACDRTPCASGF
jgi:hypothetical protein